jgi:hypothetical protein
MMGAVNPLLEISGDKADARELVGQTEAGAGRFQNPVAEIQGTKSFEGHSGKMPRLLLRQCSRGS